MKKIHLQFFSLQGAGYTLPADMVTHCKSAFSCLFCLYIYG